MATMTRAELNREAIWERIRGLHEDSMYRARNRAKGPIVARMDEVQLLGVYDRDPNGFNRMYCGPVGSEPMQAQCVALGGDLVVCFWSAVRDHSRRFLVTPDEYGMPAIWMETESRAVRVTARNKYYPVVRRIVCLHAFYGESVGLTDRGRRATDSMTGSGMAGGTR